jgi:hypothetical protein
MHVCLVLKKALEQLCSFARWLPKHAHLLRSIHAHLEDCSMPSFIQEMPADSYLEVAQMLLQPAMQLAAGEQHQADAATASQLETGVSQRDQRQLLRLAEFQSSWLSTPAVVAALPANSLTHLGLSPIRKQQSSVANTPGLAAEIQQLSSLQELHIRAGTDAFFSSCLPAIPHLPQLTQLQLTGDMNAPGSRQGLQQLLAQPLPLRHLSLELYELPALKLAALTNLEDLTAGCDSGSELPADSVLPAQLQRLSLPVCKTPNSLQVLTGLQQLQSLSMIVHFAEAEPLLRLTQLPALQHIALNLRGASAILGTAPIWRQLPQLQELCVVHSFEGMEGILQEEWEVVPACVAACTGLTKLEIDCCAFAHAHLDVEPVPVTACGTLAGLTRLQDLCFCDGACFLPGDVLALTALTGLTRLVMNHVHEGMSDLAATALACNLRQLQHLELKACSLGDMACLAAIAQLTQLTNLELQENAGITAQGLMLLTGLKQLRFLEVTNNASVTDEVLRRFRDVIVVWEQEQ